MRLREQLGEGGVAQMPRKEVGSVLSLSLPSPASVRGSVWDSLEGREEIYLLTYHGWVWVPGVCLSLGPACSALAVSRQVHPSCGS